MKQICVILSLSLVAFGATFTTASAASFDSQEATIQKAGKHTAHVTIKKDTYTAPIMFAEGANWSTVKDHYEVSCPVVCGLKAHKEVITIKADGTASFAKKRK